LAKKAYFCRGGSHMVFLRSLFKSGQNTLNAGGTATDGNE